MNEQALLQAILADPADDAPRLIYADHLLEQGQDDHADFIRCQVALANWPCECGEVERVYHDECRCKEKGELQRRVRDLLAQYWSAWLPPVIEANLREWSTLQLEQIASSQTHGWQWHRGFIDFVRLPLAVFERYGAAIAACCPVVRWELDDHEPYLREYGRGYERWTYHRSWFSTDLWTRLLVTAGSIKEGEVPNPVFEFVEFGKNHEEAVACLSAAMVALARQRAVALGLVPPAVAAAWGLKCQSTFNPLSPDEVELAHRDPGPRPERKGL